MQTVNEVIEEINKWNNKFNAKGKDDYIYETAFFKIFVKFELYMSKVFVKYSIGEETKDGRLINRKLKFRDEKHLQNFLKSGNSSYINYYERIEKLSKHIFEDEQDPFGLIFSSSNYSNYFNNMKVMRNYIAHESDESKHKYINDVLNNKAFIEPFKYLRNFKKGSSKTNYSIYIKKIEEMISILDYPMIYLKDEKDLDIPINLKEIETNRNKPQKEIAIDKVTD